MRVSESVQGSVEEERLRAVIDRLRDEASELRTRLAEAALVLTKGDANFRRLLGDLHWPHDTDFADLMREYWPTSLAALRTCKSGVLVGVVPAVEAAAAAAEPEKWLTGGVYGMVSFAPKATPS